MGISKEEYQTMMNDIQEDYQSIKSSKERKYLDDYEQGYIDGADDTFKQMIQLLKIIQKKLDFD